MLDPQNEKSWKRIQEIEAPRERDLTPEPVPFAKPQFTQAIQSITIEEAKSIVFEARVIPVGDPSMQIQWFLDDAPLKQSNRFTINEDFGLCVLRIENVNVYDIGTYSCKAINKEGAAITNASLSVISKFFIF